MAYHITIRPPLRNQQTLDALFDLLVQTNVVEAYDFARQKPQHKSLFESLITSIHEEGPSDARAQRALQLLSLPFTAEETSWFEDCLLHGGAAKCPGAKDSVLMRRLAMGDMQSAPGNVSRLKGSKVDGVNWEEIRKIGAG